MEGNCDDIIMMGGPHRRTARRTAPHPSAVEQSNSHKQTAEGRIYE